MSTESSDTGRIRASDAEREDYARTVREAVTEGRLNLSEGDERLAKVYGSIYRDELPSMVTDLPRQAGGQPWGQWGRPGSGQPDGSRRDHRGGPPWARREGAEGERPQPSWSGFSRHVAFVLVVSAILISIWAATAPGFFWPAIPLTFLAITLVKHGAWLRWGRRPHAHWR